MASNQKPVIDPCVEKIQEYYAQGRASLQSLGLRNIVLDKRLQARDFGEVSFSESHISTLLDIMRLAGEDSTLAPIVVFLVLGVHYVVDGFHRWHTYRRLRRESIQAHVIEGTWAEAVLFAAMANQMNTALTRSDADTRKAIRVLLSDDDCWMWGNARIASHVGCHAGVVSRVSAEVCQERGVERPTVVVRSDGKVCPRRNAKWNEVRRVHDRRHGSPATYIRGDRLTAEEAELLVVSARNDSRICGMWGPLSGFLESKGIVVKLARIHSSVQYSPGCGVAGRFLVATSDLETPGGFYSAVGRVLCVMSAADEKYIPVIVCPKLAGNEAMKDFATEKFGIKFLTPDELVERIKADEQKEKDNVA